MTDLSLDPAVVDACGTAADAVGRTVSGLSSKFDLTTGLLGQGGGLASADALAACHRAWSGRIRQDGDDASGTGASMHQAVKNYQTADHDAGRRVRSPGRARPD
jgi:hypothetical protein